MDSEPLVSEAFYQPFGVPHTEGKLSGALDFSGSMEVPGRYLNTLGRSQQNPGKKSPLVWDTGLKVELCGHLEKLAFSAASSGLFQRSGFPEWGNLLD